jgi:acetamidase/formamidase
MTPYFASKQVAERDVLNDARAIAASDLDHDFDEDGPHVVTGPVDVAGARPGDVLRIDVVELTPRVPYRASRRDWAGCPSGWSRASR